MPTDRLLLQQPFYHRANIRHHHSHKAATAGKGATAKNKHVAAAAAAPTASLIGAIRREGIDSSD